MLDQFQLFKKISNKYFSLDTLMILRWLKALTPELLSQFLLDKMNTAFDSFTHEFNSPGRRFS